MWFGDPLLDCLFLIQLQGWKPIGSSHLRHYRGTSSDGPACPENSYKDTAPALQGNLFNRFQFNIQLEIHLDHYKYTNLNERIAIAGAKK